MKNKLSILKAEFPSVSLKSSYIPYKKVQDILTPKLAFEWVEKAYMYMGSESEKIQMPEKLYFFYPDGDMRVMPAVAQIDNKTITGTKIVSVHFENIKRRLPTVVGFYVLVDSKTGALLCLIDATYLTAMRTGASVAVATKYLFGQKTAKVGIIGCGVQARTQIVFISDVLKIQELLIYDISSKAIEKFSKFLKKFGLNFKVAKDLKEFSECDVLITATPSREPFLKKEHVENVKLINAIGADGPGKQELDPKILSESVVVVDSREQAVYGGEINVPLKRGIIGEDIIFAELGQIVSGKKKIQEQKRIVFDSTGIAILDLFVSWGVYLKASKNKNILKNINIH
ncbi:MAG: ornithine cyclodeaminase family protein [Candidatus Calescibacterium sp.]|nr:ornithine cyclodeaminase family protein [Candidatus Calescibacterium sp.]MCX7733777.1 ornithine cyclodeaminase family protein [bacterium]MDW8087947.1 ornithine cyclodeaminase family protein [Candidatus Calescibacterium sp.]